MGSAAVERVAFDPVDSGPLAGLARGPRLVMALVRTRSRLGISVNRLAYESGLSHGHVRRCLSELERRRLVECDRVGAVAWGYGVRKVRLWKLHWGTETSQALAHTPWIPYEPEDDNDRVPPVYWHLFWSGRCASELRISRDAMYIASRLIQRESQSAMCWALEAVPVETLIELRAVRGYDVDPIRSWLDVTIKERSQ